MSKVVGIDFGTTNVRIAHRDIDRAEDTASSRIGTAGLLDVMPAVVAFRQTPDGEVQTIVGEDADILNNDEQSVEVIRNIKRLATTSDEYNRQYLEWSADERIRWRGMNTPVADVSEQYQEIWPEWWDADSRSIQVWGESINVEDVIRLILKEAISRAGLAGSVAEWRIGCPVNCDLAYREVLVSALSDLGCSGRVEWVTEEPLLVLAVGAAIGSLSDGSYLVYDLGGGSFDCAIAEIKGGNLTVYSEEGLPTLGGVNIDRGLAEKFTGDVPMYDLRVAKERLFTESASSLPLTGGQPLTRDMVINVLEEERFIQRTLTTTIDAYKKAKLLWKRPNQDNSVWSLQKEDMRQDIDRVLVVGGPTLIPYFSEKLEEFFGHGKVITAADLVLTAGRTDITEAQLTALSHGACYMQSERYVPLTVDRIPALITLKVSNGNASAEDSYQPYQKLPWWNPTAPYRGRQIHHLRSEGTATYSIQITSPSGELLYKSGPHDMRVPRDGLRGPRADRISLVLDRLGGVWVKIEAGFGGIENYVSITENLFWQPDRERERLEEIVREGRQIYTRTAISEDWRHRDSLGPSHGNVYPRRA